MKWYHPSSISQVNIIGRENEWCLGLSNTDLMTPSEIPKFPEMFRNYQKFGGILKSEWSQLWKSEPQNISKYGQCGILLRLPKVRLVSSKTTPNRYWDSLDNSYVRIGKIKIYSILVEWTWQDGDWVNKWKYVSHKMITFQCGTALWPYIWCPYEWLTP